MKLERAIQLEHEAIGQLRLEAYAFPEVLFKLDEIETHLRNRTAISEQLIDSLFLVMEINDRVLLHLISGCFAGDQNSEYELDIFETKI